jgi:catechol 2,3-dioxygenase-like lactoylglutathione lyase family enzyme
MRVSGFDHIVLMVSDVERSLGWYRDALGLAPERVEEWKEGKVPFPSVRIDEGTVIDIIRGDRDGRNVDHFCLAVDDELDVTGLDVVEGPVQRWGARGVATSFYVRDPDGNVVELRRY